MKPSRSCGRVLAALDGGSRSRSSSSSSSSSSNGSNGSCCSMFRYRFMFFVLCLPVCFLILGSAAAGENGAISATTTSASAAAAAPTAAGDAITTATPPSSPYLSPRGISPYLLHFQGPLRGPIRGPLRGPFRPNSRGPAKSGYGAPRGWGPLPKDADIAWTETWDSSKATGAAAAAAESPPVGAKRSALFPHSRLTKGFLLLSALAALLLLRVPLPLNRQRGAAAERDAEIPAAKAAEMAASAAAAEAAAKRQAMPAAAPGPATAGQKSEPLAAPAAGQLAEELEGKTSAEAAAAGEATAAGESAGKAAASVLAADGSLWQPNAAEMPAAFKPSLQQDTLQALLDETEALAKTLGGSSTFVRFLRLRAAVFAAMAELQKLQQLQQEVAAAAAEPLAGASGKPAAAAATAGLVPTIQRLEGQVNAALAEAQWLHTMAAETIEGQQQAAEELVLQLHSEQQLLQQAGQRFAALYSKAFVSSPVPDLILSVHLNGVREMQQAATEDLSRMQGVAVLSAAEWRVKLSMQQKERPQESLQQDPRGQHQQEHGKQQRQGKLGTQDPEELQRELEEQVQKMLSQLQRPLWAVTATTRALAATQKSYGEIESKYKHATEVWTSEIDGIMRAGIYLSSSSYWLAAASCYAITETERLRLADLEWKVWSSGWQERQQHGFPQQDGKAKQKPDVEYLETDPLQKRQEQLVSLLQQFYVSADRVGEGLLALGAAARGVSAGHLSLYGLLEAGERQARVYEQMRNDLDRIQAAMEAIGSLRVLLQMPEPPAAAATGHTEAMLSKLLPLAKTAAAIARRVSGELSFKHAEEAAEFAETEEAIRAEEDASAMGADAGITFGADYREQQRRRLQQQEQREAAVRREANKAVYAYARLSGALNSFVMEEQTEAALVAASKTVSMAEEAVAAKVRQDVWGLENAEGRAAFQVACTQAEKHEQALAAATAAAQATAVAAAEQQRAAHRNNFGYTSVQKQQQVSTETETGVEGATEQQEDTSSGTESRRFREAEFGVVEGTSAARKTQQQQQESDTASAGKLLAQ
ncbi:hypothetical protein, conserved [Eimeria tenella]|uniref:Uncharacterized protein n=1 Tax=Eimeria tenella TaxID=5802 RepID=U6KPV4_EIMTE|nr:hypothetical protein, conserved [Eimeria tenella]CDJ38923.1 hypothetical protein, conserved [Eimeria tenella]|eukprot:XP_013229678.1 hypothetical protein, conserved [Eimeria tenella]